MRVETAGYRNRLQVAWKNVRTNRGLRPADVINGFRMVHPLRSLSQAGQPWDVAYLVMEMLTRLEIHYRPRDIPTGRVAPRIQNAGAAAGQPRVGLFVDAPDHLSGVCKTIAEWREAAARSRRTLVMHTCGFHQPGSGAISFPPMGSVSLDAYAGLCLHIPSMDEVLRYIDAMEFDVLHLSTPGPMGLLGLLAARRRGLPVCGTYHTDFPRYAATLTGDPALEQVGWQFMRWFYGQLDRVAAPTESIRRELVDQGFDAGRLQVVGRGVRTPEFNPSYRSPGWRGTWGGRHSVKLLYVGRISREKNLETLARAFRILVRTRPDVCLVVVGEGPYRPAMQRELEGLPAFFTGELTGRDLAEAYASSDLFVFPSLTDTFGRVVLEAQASGLPVVVSDQGGPKDVMLDRRTGIMLEKLDEHNLAEAIDELTDDPARMSAYARAARRHAAAHTPEVSFDAFWSLHQSLTPTTREARHNEVMS